MDGYVRLQAGIFKDTSKQIATCSEYTSWVVESRIYIRSNELGGSFLIVETFLGYVEVHLLIPKGKFD